MLIEFISVKKAILICLAKCEINAIQVLLIGSLARGNAKSDSDADIIICFKKNNIPNDQKINDLIRLLQLKIGRKVDLIVFEYCKKFVTHNPFDIDFIENAKIDSKQIIDNSKIGKELLEMSKKIGLFKLVN